MPITAHGETIGAECPRAKILVVDDDPTIAELACAQIARLGHDSASACDGVEAWELLNTQAFNLVVSDINMPRMNGFELIERMRAGRVHRFAPVMVITSCGDTASIERAFAAGATTFVAKPINWLLFGHEVRYVLRAATLEGELRDARDRAERLIAQKDGFLSIMSHELRTPLNAIIGFAEVLSTQSKTGEQNPNQHAYLEEILNGGRRLLGTLQDMSLYSQLLSGDLALTEGEYRLSTLASEIRAVAAERAEAEGIDISMSGFDAAVSIQCDLRLLGRAIGGLVDNAVKFSPPNSGVSVDACTSMDGALAIAVRDRGPGMSVEEAMQYFEPFTQSDMSLRRSAEGLGLGLTLANALLRLHGGEIAFESVPRSGTMVRVVLPRERLNSGSTTVRTKAKCPSLPKTSLTNSVNQ